MTYEGFDIEGIKVVEDGLQKRSTFVDKSAIFDILSARHSVSTLQFRAKLTGLLIVLGGATVLATQVNASSKIAQVVVPTQTNPSPTTAPTQTNPSSTTAPTQTNPSSTTAPTQTNPSSTTAPTQTNQSPANATIIYVNPTTGADSAGAGSTEATPYKTITYALSQAQSGIVIQLAPGTYSSETGEVFPLTLKQGVTLRGDESNKGQNIIVTGGGNYVSPTFARQSVSVRAEKDSTIAGVTITNPNTRGTALWIESTNPTVRNNTFTNSNRDGIFVTGTAAPTIEANVFTKNSGNGISVAKAAQGVIRNNVFQDTGFGLAIGGTASPLVAENQINQNQDGIFLNGSARPVLRNNVIQNNIEDGIVVTVNAQPDLGTAESAGSNLVSNNTRYDVNNATRNTLIAVGNDIDPKRISGQVTLVAPQVAFADVQGYWAQPYIVALAAKNIIAGFPDGTFKPNDPVTRAQFAAIVSKAFAPAAQRGPQDFTDVSSKFWAYEAIQTAYRGGFVAGYPGGAFQPQQPIPRVQVLVSLANGLKLASDNPNAISVFTDASQIPSYATSAVAAATQRQLVVNYPTPSQLNPNRVATRAEVAAFVYQALVNAGRAQAIPSPYVVRLP